MTASTRHAKLCLSSTPTKTGKAYKLCNLSRRARIVLRTSPGIAECERQKTSKQPQRPSNLKEPSFFVSIRTNRLQPEVFLSVSRAFVGEQLS